MPLIIPPDYVQVTLVWQSEMWDTGSGATVLGFDGGSTSSPGGTAGAVQSAVVDHLMPLTTDTVTLTEARWAGETDGGVITVNEPGRLTSTVGSPNITMLLQKVTASRGRRGRGRAYWPQMVSEAEVDEAGVIATGRLNAINAALNNFTAELATAGIEQVVLQNSEGETPPFALPPIVSQFRCAPKVATQRRRLRR